MLKFEGCFRTTLCSKDHGTHWKVTVLPSQAGAFYGAVIVGAVGFKGLFQISNAELVKTKPSQGSLSGAPTERYHKRGTGRIERRGVEGGSPRRDKRYLSTRPPPTAVSPSCCRHPVFFQSCSDVSVLVQWVFLSRGFCCFIRTLACTRWACVVLLFMLHRGESFGMRRPSGRLERITMRAPIFESKSRPAKFFCLQGQQYGETRRMSAFTRCLRGIERAEVSQETLLFSRQD